MTLGIALFLDHGVRHGLARRWRQGYALPRRISQAAPHGADPESAEDVRGDLALTLSSMSLAHVSASFAQFGVF